MNADRACREIVLALLRVAALIAVVMTLMY